MFVTVKLTGILGRRFGREWQLNINSPSEALRAIGCQVEGFAKFLYESADNGIVYRVVDGDPAGLAEEELQFGLKTKTLVIAPIVQGAGGFGRILLGAALIGAAFLVPGGFLGLSSTTIGLIGGSLVLSGISQLLSPTPKTPKEGEKRESYLFDRAAGTGSQGTPVPILFGQRLVSEMLVLSSGIDVIRQESDDDD